MIVQKKFNFNFSNIWSFRVTNKGRHLRQILCGYRYIYIYHADCYIQSKVDLLNIFFRFFSVLRIWRHMHFKRKILKKQLFKFKDCWIISNMWLKDWSLCDKLKFSNANILATWSCKPLKFQTYIVIHRYTTLRCKDIGFRKSEIVTKTQFL